MEYTELLEKQIKLLEDFELTIHGGLKVKFRISIKKCNRGYTWIYFTP